MKRTLAIFLTVMMLLSALPLAGLNLAPKASALASTGQCGENVFWSLDESTGTLTISGTGDMYDYDFNTSPFCYNSYIEEIMIEAGVTSIGWFAFENCRSLTSITIPDSVTSIGENAFSVCFSLTSITIPDSVTSIGAESFHGCISLTSITIPDSVTSIGDNAFNYCCSLTSIVVNDNNKKYDSRNNCNAIIETATNTLIVGCIDTIIPDSVTSIGDSAFCDCDSLTSITIPDSVTSIGSYAFGFCSSLTSITIPDSVTSIGERTFEYCENLTSVTIPDSVTSIGAKSFYSCSSLTSIAIPDSVTSIGDSAFEDCNSLTSITIPDSVTSIGSYAFAYCRSLTSITIPDSVTSIGKYAFCFCDSLTSITIPDSVTSIGENAFERCSSLTSIVVNDNNKKYDSRNNCNAIIETATNTLIVGCKDTIIPDSVTSIGDSAFCDCDSLTSITIPDSVTSIGDSAFEGCSSLTSITIPNSVTSIGDSAFYDCDSLTSITIPDSVTSIGSYAFGFCSSLTSITIPDSVTTIEWSAFDDCNSLSDVYYGGTREQWNQIKIDSYGNNDLLNATIHFAKESHVHTLSHIVTPASCVVKGMEYDICVECGEVLNSVTTPEKGHSWGEWVTVTEPTVDSEGLSQRECTVCKEKETQPIPKLNVAKDEKSGVEIVFSDEFDKDVDVTVSDAFDGQSLQLIDAKYPDSQTAIFDITTTQNGEKVQPDGSVTVRIPLPDGFSTENIFVCYVDSVNGNVTKIPATVENGYVVFTAEHFSHYAIIELLDSFVNYIKKAGIEINDKIACGFLPGTTVSDLKNLTSFICDVDVKTADGSDTIGTGSAITFTSITGKVIECTAIVFGDTNGDGWYDGMDSVVTNCLANGILSKEQVGEAVFAAADCNHDNIVDEKDVAILEQAGLILAKINQNKPAEELLADESYSEYISLIDQTVKAEEAPADSTADSPVDEEFNMSFIQRIFDFIVNILNFVKAFVSQF